MRNIGGETLRRLFWAIALLSLVATVGCDHPPPLDPAVPVDVKIRRLVFDVDDFSQDPRELKVVPRLFAPGHEPAEKALQRYAQFRYEDKKLAQTDDTATVVVALKDAKSGEARGEVTWSMQKINGIWKLTDAPLPEK